MKIACFSFLMLVLGVTLNAQSDAQPQLVSAVVDNGLRWDHTTHDFGEIAQGTPQTAEFVLTNTGTDAMIVTGVKSSCGCTGAQHTEGPIGPGESTIITATYNAKKPGVFHKTVKVSTNRQEVPIVLTVQGKVIAD